MKKKKLLAAFAAAAVLAVGGGALAGCNPKHEHTYSDDWEKDASGHWHVATCDDLKSGDDDYVSGYQEHVWGGDDECDVCHYKKEATPAANEYTITFNVGDLGTLPKGTSNTVKTEGGKIKTLPTPTAKDDKHTFAGWYDAAEGGKAVTTATAFTANATVYAHWDEVETEFTVTLDANGGTLEGEETVDLETKDGKLAELPTPTAPTGMEFVGWFTEDVGGEEVTAATEFEEDTTVYAQYIYVYTITLNAGDGTLATSSIKAKDGKITELPTPTAPSGKQFVGWFTAADGGKEVTTATEFEEDTTIYAQYASVCTVTLNVGTDGTLPEGAPSTLTTKGGKLESLPTPVTQNAIVFIGWFTAETDGEEVTTDTVFSGETSEVTIYARYRQEIAVTLNVGEGTLPAGASATMVTSENKLADLPEPVAPENKWFKGWYTAATDGVKVEAATNLLVYADANHAATLYARYVEEATVTLEVGTEGTLPEGAVTSYKTVNGKIVLPEGQRGLPAVTTGKDHWVFYGWFDGNTAVNVETAVFDKNTTLTAKVGREDGVWVGEKFINPLTLNQGAAPRREYWLGGGKITLTKGDVINLYINGNLISHFIEQNSAGVAKGSGQVSAVNVTVTGEFVMYLHQNTNDWSCEYGGPTEVNVGSEIPAGCDAVTITIGSLDPITLFVKDSDGNGVSKADFSKYVIYTYSTSGDKALEIFGGWQEAGKEKGRLQEEMNSNATKMPEGWIFRWGAISASTGNGGNQTANIVNVFKAGKTYVVELPKNNNGTAKITELTLTATYKITLDQNYEGQPETKLTAKAYNGKLTYLPTFTREGYEDKDLFWYTAAEGGEKITLDTVFTTDTTIYARWSEKIKITPNYNYEGCDTASDVTIDNGKFATLPTAPTRDDYDFLGWFTAAENGDEITVDTVFDKNSTIFAHWQLKKVITVDQNYEGKPENITVKANNGKLNPLPTADTREDYDFLGWFMAATEGEKVTTATEFTQNATIYAQWKLKIVITVNLNYEGKSDDTTVKANNGKLTALPEEPTREGYEFVGWYTEAEAGTQVKTSTTFTENATIYARWRLPFKVTFIYNYENCPEPLVLTAVKRPNSTLSKLPAGPETPVREGYNFLGWFDTQEATGGKQFYASNSISSDQTWYARWQLPVKITFDLNYEGQPEEMEQRTATLVANATYSTLPAEYPNPTRAGLEFVGWFDTKEATGGKEMYYSANNIANNFYYSDTTLYARWRAPLTVTFDLNYDGQPEKKTTLNTVARGYLAEFPADPVREGYVFNGWNTKASSGGTYVRNTNTQYTEDTTLYARWVAAKTVTFDLNYEGQPEEKTTAKTVNGNVISALPENPTRTGYTFAGWFTAEVDGTEVTVETKFTKDTTVYAHWTPVTEEQA